MGARLVLGLLVGCFFLSGLAALIYQTAWTRQFAFVFGTSELAVATVLAAYMAGLALGAAVAARLAPRILRPVLVYGLLEFGVGATALAVPLAIRASTALYVAWFGGGAELAEAGGTRFVVFFLVCSLAILVVPTALMGATLPLLIRHAVRRSEEIGSRVSLLYAANTAGAVVGTLLAGFVLLPALGLSRTVWVAVGLNAAVFAAAFGLARIAPAVTEIEARGVRAPWSARSWILPLMLVSGVCSFTYEVLWTRLLAHVLGGSVYAFATMLATFLTGIALGALGAARFATSPARAAGTFAWVQLGTAVLSLVAYAGLGWLPPLVRALHAGLGASLAADAAVAAFVLLPSTLCIGATFPLAVRVLCESQADAGPASARVYAWNTLGAITGALGAGFFLIPGLGYAGALGVAVGTNLVLAAAAPLLVPRVSRRVWLPAAALGALLLVVRVQPPWNLLLSSLGAPVAQGGPVLDYAVGRTATVLVVERPHGFQLRSNGLIEAEILRRGERAARDVASHWLGTLPVLARPDARSLFVIGLGGGVAIENLPRGVEQVDVVELEPRVVDANRAVGAQRRADPLADPRVRVAVNDARASLLLTQRRFDAIVSQPSHPWVAGAAHLYTREFFELARSRLADDGVFVQWLGLQFVDVELLQSVVATLREVFPHVQVYSPLPDWVVLFLASSQPFDLDASAARALADDPAPFAELGLLSSDDVRAGLLLDEPAARLFSEGAPLNTDDYNLLQVRSPHLLVRYAENQRAWRAVAAELDPLPEPGAPGDPAYLVRRLARSGQRDRALRLAESAAGESERRRLRLLASSAHGRVANPVLSRALEEQPDDPELRALDLLLGHATGEAEPLREGWTPPEQLVVDGWKRERRGDWPALQTSDAALAEIDPRDPLFEAALRLRIGWREASGRPRDAREAMNLLAPVLAVAPALADVELRARLAIVAEDVPAALASLLEWVARPDASAESLRRAAARLERIPPPDDDRLRWAAVRQQLVARGALPRGSRSGGPTASPTQP